MLSFMLELCSKCFSFSETKRRSMLDPEIFKVTLWDSMTVVGVTVLKLLGLKKMCMNLHFTIRYQNLMLLQAQWQNAIYVSCQGKKI